LILEDVDCVMFYVISGLSMVFEGMLAAKGHVAFEANKHSFYFVWGE
jgi:hypothetical protein